MNNITADHFYAEMTKKNIGVYTPDQQARLRHSKVIIFGLGGVGGLEAILCARSGIGHISGVDPDIFEVSNINRQMLATTKTVDHYKSEMTEAHLKEINPYLTTHFHAVRVDESNVLELMRDHDLVLEALDDMPSRVIVHRAAKSIGIPSISMSGSPPHRGFVSTFLPEGIAYEDALNIPVKGKSISDPAVSNFIQDLKKKRALYSVTRGAPKEWAQDFCEGKAGWIITPIRASLLASFSCHEAIQVLIEQPPLAIAPTAIIIDLDDMHHPVSVKIPENGYWEASEI